MNKSKLNFLILSLPAVAVLFMGDDVNAGLHINNSSYIQNQAAAASARTAVQNYEPQPARVIKNDNGETTTVSAADMDRCNAIYPGGVFDWIKPTTGTHRGGSATCAALVELRSYKNTDYTVLASAYLASGDSMKCNVDNFREFTPAGRDFTYPADSEPTIEDVEKVMAAEQKSNAGIKILAAAVVGGIGGNLVGKSEVGSDSPLGTNKEKLQSTAIGALGGAALMTASTQSNDYKVGTTIMSTGINAAAGAVAGNLMASGDDILKIEKCTLKTPDATTVGADGNTITSASSGASFETTCLYGAYDIGAATGEQHTVTGNLFFNLADQKAYQCKDAEEDSYKNCRIIALTQVSFDSTDAEVKKECEAKQSVSADCIKALKKANFNELYKYNKDDKIITKISSGNGNENVVKIASAQEVGRNVSAMIQFTESQGAFGIKHSEWLSKYSGKYANGLVVYDIQGNPLKNAKGEQIVGDINNFYPSAQSAEDGDMVDFNNRARTKSTLIGAGGGAALGALSGVSGANSEIQNRWMAATREYQDSLNNVVCATGQRFLSKYNDAVLIPAMSPVSE